MLRLVTPVRVVYPLADACNDTSPVWLTAPIEHVSVMRPDELCWFTATVAGAPVQPDAIPDHPGVRVNVVCPVGVLVLEFVTVNPVAALVAPPASGSDAFCGDTDIAYTVVALMLVVAESVVDPDVAASVRLPLVPFALTL